MKFLVDEINSGERIDIYLSKKINFLIYERVNSLIISDKKTSILLLLSF